MDAFAILQIEIQFDGTQVDVFHMASSEVLQMKEEAVSQIQSRASQIIAPRALRSLTYLDDEGDACTLNKDTLADALSFVEHLGDAGVGVLRVNVHALSDVVAPPKELVQAPETSPAAKAQPSKDDTLEAAALSAINTLAKGADLRHLVPVLAEVALNIVATAEEPTLFPLIDLLHAFKEGKHTAADLPSVLPEIVAVVTALPMPKRLTLLSQARLAAEEAVATLQHEENSENVCVEVHPGIICDGCNCAPIVGPRYKSLERDDFDLCGACYGHEDRQPNAWVQIKSDVRGDVISSYYAPPTDVAAHHGVQCDGCNMVPIVGRRFKARGEDFDLCGACMESWMAGSQAGTKSFEEITVTTAAAAVATEEENVNAKRKESLHIQLHLDGEKVDMVRVMPMQEDAVNEIMCRARQVVAPKMVKSLTYQDDEGDSCTLTKDTLTDALSFAEPCTDVSMGVLHVQVHCHPQATAPVEQPEHHTDFFDIAVANAINRLCSGIDLHRLVPKLAEVALDIVANADQPELSPLKDIFEALRDGRKTTADLPQILPEIVAVIKSMPWPKLAPLIAQMKAAAMEALAKLQQEPSDNATVEVHCGIICDGCDCTPIVGPRYKSLEHHDFDLCASCFNREDRRPDAWTQIMSSMIVPAAVTAVATKEEPPETEEVPPPLAFDFSSAEVDSPVIGESVYQNAIQMLLQHPDAVVRSAARDALSEASKSGNAQPDEVVAHYQIFSPASPRSVTTETIADEACVDETAAEAVEEAAEAVVTAVEVGTEAVDAVVTAVEAVEKTVDAVETAAGAVVTAVETCIDEVVAEAVEAVTSAVGHADVKQASAKVLNCGQLVLGVEADEDASARGDVTAELAEVVIGCGATQAYRIGRLVLDATGCSTATVPACAKAVIVNDGVVPWPETTAVTLAFGPSHDFPHMELGALQPGEAAEIVLDLSVAVHAASSKTVWAIVDTATGAPLGPLLCFEVVQQ